MLFNVAVLKRMYPWYSYSACSSVGILVPVLTLHVRVLAYTYLVPGLQCISNNIAEERNLPDSHIRLQNMISLESNVTITAGIPHGAV